MPSSMPAGLVDVVERTAARLLHLQTSPAAAALVCRGVDLKLLKSQVTAV
jgi:hypothetical protein